MAGPIAQFTLAWPWLSRTSREKTSLSIDESSFENLAEENAACSFFQNELELLECAVADESETSEAEVKEHGGRRPSAIPTGSVMRAVLRDELYRALTESTHSSSGEAPAVAPGQRRISVKFVDPQSHNNTLKVDIGRKVMWGNVDVTEFEREKEWSPEFEEQVSKIRNQHNGAELEAVYKLLVDEFLIPRSVFIITSGGKKFRATVCVTDEQQLVVRREAAPQTVEVQARISDISSVRFGLSKTFAPLVKKDTHVRYRNEHSLSVTFTTVRRRSTVSTGVVAVSQGGGVVVGLCFVFGGEAERNSFGLLLRTMNRVVQSTSIGDWEDAIDDMDTETEDTEETEESEVVEEASKQNGQIQEKEDQNAEQKTPTAAPAGSEKADLSRLTQCLTALAAGMQVKKVTKKGALLDRKLSLAGVSLAVVSPKGNKGQIVGVFDDVVKTEAGQDDACFDALKEKQPLPPVNRCAVVKLTDHSFALIFGCVEILKSYPVYLDADFQLLSKLILTHVKKELSEQQRDNFVYAMNHLQESDEVLKYL